MDQARLRCDISPIQKLWTWIYYVGLCSPRGPNVQSIELIQMMKLRGNRADLHYAMMLIYASKHENLLIYGGKSDKTDSTELPMTISGVCGTLCGCEAEWQMFYL